MKQTHKKATTQVSFRFGSREGGFQIPRGSHLKSLPPPDVREESWTEPQDHW